MLAYVEGTTEVVIVISKYVETVSESIVSTAEEGVNDIIFENVEDSTIVIVKYSVFAAAAESVTGMRRGYPMEFTWMSPIVIVGVSAKGSVSEST